MKIKVNAALLAFCLAAHGEAFNFGNLFGTASSALKGVSNFMGTLDVYRNDGVVCPVTQYTAKALSTNSLCQLVEDFEAMDACRSFGSSCVSIPGQWGCGYIVTTESEKQRGCLFRPRRTPNGVKLPKIYFDFEDDELSGEHYNDGERCVFRKNPINRIPAPWDADAHMDDDIIPIDYESSSDFYAKTVIYDLQRYHDVFTENEEARDKSPTQALTAIVKVLDLSGIRYPIGKSACNNCKDVCNKIYSGNNLDRCKYDACVKFLGGYRGSEASPSCLVIPLP